MIYKQECISTKSALGPSLSSCAPHPRWLSPTALQQGALFTSGLFSVCKLHKKAGRAVYFVHSYILTAWNTAGAQ